MRSAAAARRVSGVANSLGRPLATAGPSGVASHAPLVCQACQTANLRSQPYSSRCSDGLARPRFLVSTAAATISSCGATTSSLSTSNLAARRAYHSRDHPPAPDPFTPTENAILSAAHAHVAEHGFTDHALAMGARDAGYPDITATAVPDGVFGLIRWHLVTRRAMLETRALELFAGTDPTGPSDVDARAERLTWERLLANRAIIGRWQDALAVMAQPSHAPAALKELAQLADDIWFLAGDVAVDPSWYTKRASLAAAYAATDLFMTNDRSPDFHESREFLARRFANASEVGGLVRSVGQWAGFTASAGLNVLRSKGMMI